MPPSLRAAVAVLVPALLLAGCSTDPDDGSTVRGGLKGATTTLASGTCWTDEVTGADPQEVLRLSREYDVSYFPAAHALEDRPAFKLTASCGSDHAVEVYKAVRMADVPPVVTSYGQLLVAGSKTYLALDASVGRACMNKVLFDAAAASGFKGAVMQPAFPEGYELGWAPVSEAQWEHGQRTYACTLTQTKPGRLRYASVFGKGFPTGLRTCIDSSSLIYVDCARKHDREVISVINLRQAVLARQFPGPKKIITGSKGRYLDVSPAQYAALDRACTVYLRAVSTTKKLSGVAEIDADRWPAPDGSYPVSCEADAKTTDKSVITTGSVFDRL